MIKFYLYVVLMTDKYKLTNDIFERHVEHLKLLDKQENFIYVVRLSIIMVV